MVRCSSVALLLISCALGCHALDREHEAHELIEKCKDLQVGMSFDEVVQIMGKPQFIKEVQWRGRPERILVFTSPRRASEQTMCITDVTTGRLVEIRCGEGYRRTSLEQKCMALEVGMTHEEVNEIMGPPHHIEEFMNVSGTGKEQWLYFISPRYPACVIRCSIDQQTRRLKSIHCD